MKKLLVLVLLIALVPLARAQKVTCMDCKMNISTGSADGFELLIPRCDADDISKSMQKWLKKHDGDVNEKKGEIKASNVLFKEFYQIPVTIYSTVEPSGADVKMKVYVDAGAGYQSVQSQTAVYQQFKEAVRAFSVAEAKEAAQARLEAGQKELGSLNSQMASLKKDKERLQKEIDDCNATIKQNTTGIQTNDVNQDKKTGEVNGQTEKVKQLEAELSGIY